MTALNVDGLLALSETMTKTEMCGAFGIKRDALTRYMNGSKPNADRAARLNFLIADRLKEGPDVREIFAKYLYIWANHRLSVDEAHIGAISPCKVLRYPLARAEVCQLYEALTCILYCDKRHLFDWLARTYKSPKTILGAMLRRGLIYPCPDRINITRRSGMDPLWVECYYMDLSKEENAPFLCALQISAARDDPELDGRVKVEL